MSRAMRSSARKRTNAAATTIIKSEIGRRNANDTKLIVPPQPAAAPGRPSAPRRRQRNHGDIWEKCGSDLRSYAQALEIQRPQASSRTWTANRLGRAGGLRARTTEEVGRP